MFFFQKSANEPIVDGDDNFFDLEDGLIDLKDIAEDVTPAPVKHVQLKSWTNVKGIFFKMLTFFQYFSTVKLNSTCDMAVEKKSEFEQKSEKVYAKNENLCTETLDLSKVETSDTEQLTGSN
jgi:hypothetical protein